MNIKAYNNMKSITIIIVLSNLYFVIVSILYVNC